MLLMSKMRKSTKIAFAGIFVALGILIPYVTGHAFGLSGAVILPMHIPIFLLGFVCGPVYGAIGGLIVPLLSSMMTGMPAVYPMLPVMMGELMIYGLLSGYFYQKVKIPLYPALIISMISGRVVHGGIFAVLLFTHNTSFTLGTITADFITGIPGTILQLLIVPTLVITIRRLVETPQATHQEKEEYLIRQAVEEIKKEECCCVVIQKGRVVTKCMGMGITPILDLLEREPELLENSIVVDKIVGKAASMLFVLGKVSAVHGVLMSKSAEQYLKNKGVYISCERCIDVISNRTGDGICPLEKSVKDISDEKEAYEVLKQTMVKLRKAV